MIPTDRDEFKAYCLRALGAPVLQINVDDAQAEDRIDEALYVYQQYHMDAVYKDYMKHKITASTMILAAPSTFSNNEVVTGQSSNATAAITSTTNAISFEYYMQAGTFTNNEVIVGRTSGATATISSFTNGDMDNKYFPIGAGIIGITRIFPPFDSRMSAEILFDPQSQFNISLLSNFTSNSIIPYVIGRQYQQLLNDTFRGRPVIRFQRHMSRLYVDVNWWATFGVGHYLIIEGYRVIDPEQYDAVWRDEWLQRYTIALLKRQWGLNLSKFNGIALPGGVTLDGRSILVEANQDVKDLREELKSTYELPIDFMIG